MSDLLGGNEGVAGELRIVEIGFSEVDAGDLVVVVTGVVIETAVEIAAGGVDGDVVVAVPEVDNATLVVDRVEDMEELADVGVVGDGLVGRGSWLASGG